MTEKTISCAAEEIGAFGNTSKREKEMVSEKMRTENTLFLHDF